MQEARRRKNTGPAWLRHVDVEDGDAVLGCGAGNCDGRTFNFNEPHAFKSPVRLTEERAFGQNPPGVTKLARVIFAEHGKADWVPVGLDWQIICAKCGAVYDYSGKGMSGARG